MTKAPSPNGVPSSVKQLLVELSATILDLVSLQQTITNLLETILRFILCLVAPDVDFNRPRRSISTDIDKLHATAEELVRAVKTRSTLNIKKIIMELESLRVSLMKNNPCPTNRADITTLSRTSKLLVDVMRVLPDMYDSALTKAVSLKMKQS